MISRTCATEFVGLRCPKGVFMGLTNTNMDLNIPMNLFVSVHGPFRSAVRALGVYFARFLKTPTHLQYTLIVHHGF
jgi:hypothetical protein